MTPSTPPPPPPPSSSEHTHGRFASEVMAGGSVVENTDDELVSGWRSAAGLAALLAFFVYLAVNSVWWLVFVVGVLVAIFLHELGHFMTARMTGMKATQFFIGFGPRIWSFRRGETEYGLRVLPLGAFVRIIGMNRMDTDVDPADESRTYRSKSFPRRLLVITAGSLMHMLLAIVLLFTVYVADGEPYNPQGVPIAEVVDGAPAAVAGVRAGDVIMEVDGSEIYTMNDLVSRVQAFTAGDIAQVTVERDGSLVGLEIRIEISDDTASPIYGKPQLGVVSGVEQVGKIEHSVPSAALNAVVDIFPQAWDMSKTVVKVMNPVSVFSHLVGTNDDLETRPTTLVGVTGISDDVGDAFGLMGLLHLLAVLNIFIGVFNMFPLLPLDGGHAAIAVYERIRERDGARYHADVERLMPFAMGVVAVLGFMFLTGLWLDITKPL